MKINTAPVRRVDARDGRRGGRAGGVGATENRDEARLFRRRPARHVAMADQVVGEPGEAVGRAHHGQALPRLADGPDAAALRLRAHRAGRRLLVPARRDARALPADRAHPAALPRRQRRDRHQDAQRSRAAGEISRRRAPRRQGAAAAHPPAGQRAHDQEADPHDRRHEGHAHPLRLAHDPRFRRRARRHAGRRAGDRAGRATAEGHDRRHVHRLRRRRHRLQDGRHR